MLSLLNKLQRKPERFRRKVAFIGAAAATGIIATAWLVTALLGEVPSVASERADNIGPFRTLSENIGSMLDETRATLQEAAGVFPASPSGANASSASQEPTLSE